MASYVAPDGSISVASMPGASTPSYTIPGQVTLQNSAGLITPVTGGIGLQGGSDQNWANLGRDELNALIQYRNAVLAQQTAAANAQNALSSRQLDMQGSQFDKQLFFNEQAQRASERQFDQNLAQQANIAERARQTQQMLGNYDAANQALQLAQNEALQRQNLSLQGYTAAEAARAQQQAQALQTAQLIASLRGPSNTFKQLEVLGYLNGQGAAPLLGALAGTAGVPMYQAPQAAPEAATLGTMARDAGAPLQMTRMPDGSYAYVAPSFNDAAGIQGLLRVAAQNEAYVPTDPATGQPSGTYADLKDRIARENIELAEKVAGDRYGPGSSAGAQVIKEFQTLLAARNGQIPAATDPELLKIWTNRGLSQAQAQTMAGFFADWVKQYGGWPTEGQLNDALGQISIGQPIDPTKWRQPGQALPTQPGNGTQPGQVPGAGQPPGSGPGSSVGAQILAAVAAAGASGRQMTDDEAIRLWQSKLPAGTDPAWARAAHQAAKDYAVRYGVPMNEGQLNDLFGQVSAGHQPDPNQWRQPAPSTPAIPNPPATPPTTTPPTTTPPTTTPPATTPPATTPPATTPPATTPPATTPPATTPPATTPPAGTPPATAPPAAGGGSSAGAQILAAVQQFVSSGRQMTDADAIAIWKSIGLNDQQAAAAHQAAKNAQITAGGTLTEGQLNDLLGQVQAGQTPDPTKWRQPIVPRTAQGAQTGNPAQPIDNTAPANYQQDPNNPNVARPAPSTNPAPPNVTYTFDWLPGGVQGYRGTDGSMYDVNWNRIGGQTATAPTQNATQPSYVAPAAPVSNQDERDRLSSAVPAGEINQYAGGRINYGDGTYAMPAGTGTYQKYDVEGNPLGSAFKV